MGVAPVLRILLTRHIATHWYRFLDGELVYKIEAAALNMSGGIVPEEPMYVSPLLCVSQSFFW
jgi:hypothetical protein